MAPLCSESEHKNYEHARVGDRVDEEEEDNEEEEEEGTTTRPDGFVILDDFGVPFFVPSSSIAYMFGAYDAVPCVAWEQMDEHFTRAHDPTQAFMTAENIVSFHGSEPRTVFLKSASDSTCHLYGLWFAMQTRVCSETADAIKCEPYGFSFLWLHTHTETEHMYDQIVKNNPGITHKKPACLLPNARQSFRPSPLDILGARKMSRKLFRRFPFEVRRALVRTIESINMAPYEPQHNNLLCTELYKTDDFDEEIEIDEVLASNQENNSGIFDRSDSTYDLHSFLTSPLVDCSVLPLRESPLPSLSPSARSHCSRYQISHASPSTSSRRKRSRMASSSSSLLSIYNLASDASHGCADWSLFSADVEQEIVGHLADLILADPEESAVGDFLKVATISYNMRSLLHEALAARIYTGAAHARALIRCYDGSNLESLPRLLSSTQRHFCCSPRYLSNLPASPVKLEDCSLDENERELQTIRRWVYMRLNLSASPEVIRMRASVHL